MILRPQAGPQEVFLSSPADIAIYGGANGGSKTWALLMEAIRHVANPRYGAVLFRRETPQITNEGGMWDESFTLYFHIGGKPTQQPYHQWNFPSGAAVTMTHLQHEKTVCGWDGSQLAMAGFDQLEQSTRKQFLYMPGRMRSTSGVRPYTGATCNPDPDCFLVDWDIT